MEQRITENDFSSFATVSFSIHISPLSSIQYAFHLYTTTRMRFSLFVMLCWNQVYAIARNAIFAARDWASAVWNLMANVAAAGTVVASALLQFAMDRIA